MPSWDVFHSDRLEVERGLETASVQSALELGNLTEDDLIRPTGSGLPWERIGDRLDLWDPIVSSQPTPEQSLESNESPLTTEVPDFSDRHDRFSELDVELEILPDEVNDEASSTSFSSASEDDLDLDDELEILEDIVDKPVGRILPAIGSAVAIPVPGPAPLPWDEGEFDVELDDEVDKYDPLEEDEAVAEFTLARGSAETVEELDLAAMVDVAFQLVLFFLVTATTVLYKSLEVPKPNADAPPEAATQGRSKSLDELKADYILVEMDASGIIRIDRQPVPGNLTMIGLAEKLRTLRTDTGRTAMLFSAEYATPHSKAVLAYDAANEIGLAIKIAKPTGGATSVAPPAVIKKS